MRGDWDESAPSLVYTGPHLQSCPDCGLDVVPHSPFASRLVIPLAPLGFSWLPTVVWVGAKGQEFCRSSRVHTTRIHFAVLMCGLNLITC